MRMLVSRDTLKVVVVVLILGAASALLGYCAVHAGVCTPIRTCTATITTGCATPTPVIAWDPDPDVRIAGYSVFYNEPGGTPQKLADYLCPLFDHDGDPSTPMVRVFTPTTIGFPTQRAGPTRIPGREYVFTVKWYTADGIWSDAFSNPVTICEPPLCVKPGPCN